MTVLDRQSGEILHMKDYSKEKVMFAHSLAHYEIRESREQNRLLVFYDDLNRNEAVCIVIDEESWETVGIYRGIAAYLPQDNSVLVQPFLNGTFRCPLFSLEDLLKQAKQITEAREP